MKLWLAKVERDGKVGLIPTDDLGRTVLSRLDNGECFNIELSRPRSIDWHRMYFGICRSIGESQDPQRDESSIDAELRIRAGHYDVLYIGENPAASFLDAVCTAVSHVLPESTAERLRSVIEQLSRGHEVRVPKRIAFDKLSADRWAELWPSLELAIREHFGEEYIPEKRAA